MQWKCMMMRRRRVYMAEEMVQWVLKGLVCAFLQVLCLSYHTFFSHGQIDLFNSGPWNRLKAWRHSLVSIYIGMWPCNVAFVCQKIFECNDDCLCWQSKANGLGRQSFVSWVELIIVDGLPFVDNCQSLMMGATSMFSRKEGHGCHILLLLHPGRQTDRQINRQTDKQTSRQTNNIKPWCLVKHSLMWWKMGTLCIRPFLLSEKLDCVYFSPRHLFTENLKGLTKTSPKSMKYSCALSYIVLNPGWSLDNR